ncbi:MAG: ABC transporter substrate-binding protein [Alphaproteobacteria bacterium]|nr:ABC transporter substrate-binding protein [Alphaproteobacteria bacterium]
MTGNFSGRDLGSLTRRQLLGAGLAVGVVGTGWAAEPEKPKTMVVNSSGGVVNKALRKAFFTEFERRHGIRIIDTSPADTAKLRAMVASGNVEWDVTEIAGQDGVLAERLGLLEPLDHSIIDLSRFPDAVKGNKYLFPRSVYSTVLGYRKDKLKAGHPVGWAQFWDVKKFPGRRSLRNHPVDNLEYALLADGVPKDKLYPIDLDRAFRKLDEIRPHINVWWTAGAQPAQLLIDGEVDMATGWSGRFYDLVMKDAPVAIEWEGGAVKESDFAIPKGAKNVYWSQKFLALMAEAERQAIYTNELGYPGLNLDLVKFVEPKVLPLLITSPENLPKQFFNDIVWWADNQQVAIDRWNKWMLKG